MGIWDFMYGATDSVKRNSPDLTALMNWCPTPGYLNQIAPDATAAKNVCSSAYGYGSATVTHIDSAVRDLNQHLKDEEVRSKIFHVSKSIAKQVAIEGLKTIPGYNIVNNSINELKDLDKQEVDVKAWQIDLCRFEKGLNEYKKLHEQVPMDQPNADLKIPNTVDIHSAVNQKPEDVIRVFMMKEFIGNKFFDDLMVPWVTSRKK